MLSKQDMEELLEQPEGRALDFKEGQYPFSGVGDEQKCELLKDILAFANTPRMNDAHILIGVREVKGDKPVVVGVTEHLDDASVQQFVNGKTNRAVGFSYEIVPFNGVQIGVLRVFQKQSRPLWSLKRCGGVVPRIVYVRHGSSTEEASPDEIAENARSEVEAAPLRQPVLTISLHDPQSDQTSKAQHFDRKRLVMPDPATIPEFNGAGEEPLDVLQRAFHELRKNKEYYRQGALFLSQEALLVSLNCCVQNVGDAVANGVRVILTLDCDPAEVDLLTLPAILHAPRPNTNMLVVQHLKSEMRVERSSKGWVVHRDMPKIYAKQGLFFRDELFIRATRSVEIAIQATVWADELSGPAIEPLSIRIEVEQETVSVEPLMTLLDARALEMIASNNYALVVPSAPPQNG